MSSGILFVTPNAATTVRVLAIEFNLDAAIFQNVEQKSGIAILFQVCKVSPHIGVGSDPIRNPKFSQNRLANTNPAMARIGEVGKIHSFHFR